MLKIYQACAGDFPLAVHMLATNTKSGIIVQLLGGERPHIGATVITHPRPSLITGGGISCNSIIIPELGHKEDQLAKPLAEKIATVLNTTVVLIAGIHVDNLGREEIQKVIQICWQLVDDFLKSDYLG